MKNICEIKYLKYSETKYRNHVGISFFIVLTGNAMVTIKGVSSLFNEGDAFVVKHNECYKLDVLEDNVVVQIHLFENLIGELLPDLLCESSLKKQIDLSEVREELIKLCSLYLSKEENRNLKILKCIITILEIYSEQAKLNGEECNEPAKDVNPVVEEVKSYIYQHYNERITMHTFTDKYHYSESYFSKLFKEKVGMNFKDYLTEIRLLNSIYDLIHTRAKVIDISEKHGFYNVSTYINAFKGNYGVTPKKYRNMFQSERARFARSNFFNEVDNEKRLSEEEIKVHIKNFEYKYKD